MISRKILLLLFSLLTIISSTTNETWIRINQIGYLEKSIKVAVVISKSNLTFDSFQIFDAISDKLVYSGKQISEYGSYLNFTSTFRINFSEFQKAGSYYIKIDDTVSPFFRIGNDVFDGTADYLLNYMRQQRCGFNPFLNDSCHVNDGFRIYHPENDSLHIDVTGGWHDASDYLQYVTTSANAAFQMMFAYQQNPNSFGDYYDATGIKGSNGIPDILDEAKWGVDWLLKMNSTDDEFYNQIADDRDHMSFRLPTLDSVSYGKGLERPVYLATGKPQGVLKHKNRSDGLASTVGKYSSTFSLAAQVLKPFYPELTETLMNKAKNAYEVGKENPGVCQTAPCRAPYFYEEDNYTDDMELAAIQLYNLTNEKNYLNEAIDFGKKEISTPWMGADSAKHYQWYPFVNLGHSYLSSIEHNSSKEFTNYLKTGLSKIYNRGKENPFLNGIPFIWCSNNLVAAALTQSRLYSETTNDSTFLEMESSLLDWLFGCNPWGTSMIVGLPGWGDYPSDPHSAFWHNNNFQTFGGLVDGPVYAAIFNNLIGIQIYGGDEYSEFQNDYVVYHDDYGDYSTNEPTMDGTASLSYYFSSMQKLGNSKKDKNIYAHGAIVRGDTTQKKIVLVFTGHEFADGREEILSVLEKHNIKANFFFTGEFYRNKNFSDFIKKLKNDGHYLGAHSDKHLLYVDWELRDSTLISKSEFIADIKNNYKEMEKFGIKSSDSKIFLPPFEWYNNEISNWTKELGLTLVNFSSGTNSNADYTIPSMTNYKSSEKIFESIINYEKENSLNGFILLMHIGTSPERKDKFHDILDKLIIEISSKGYTFELINKLDK